jgi:hypothetical protein
MFPYDFITFIYFSSNFCIYALIYDISSYCRAQMSYNVPAVYDVNGGIKGLALARPPPFMCWNEAWERSDLAE